MAGDHFDYVKPKTDGTFGLRTNWQRLAANQVASSSAATLPFQPAAPVTAQELSTRSLREFWNWRQWRTEGSPFEQWSLRGQFANYRHRYLSSKVPSGKVVTHFCLFVAAFGFVVNYGKNASHLYAKHH